jgi:hypothetical protein
VFVEGACEFEKSMILFARALGAGSLCWVKEVRHHHELKECSVAVPTEMDSFDRIGIAKNRANEKMRPKNDTGCQISIPHHKSLVLYSQQVPGRFSIPTNTIQYNTTIQHHGIRKTGHGYRSNITASAVHAAILADYSIYFGFIQSWRTGTSLCCDHQCHQYMGAMTMNAKVIYPFQPNKYAH